MSVPHPLSIALTYKDYLGFPNDGNRHEILEGEHRPCPKPMCQPLTKQDTFSRSSAKDDP